ncbi:MAG: glucose-1-phosphate adenylyltransferase [Candidatus Omnitrophica bacterium]|nr:glucose-1-phosphate adenylyltransferase [Candidatus Omnitrophota bacterium]
MKRTLALILGGGQGKRLFPLTMYRSKPAVPIGGKYRLIDIPISNCLHSGLKDIYVLTQFNSESLNNHINNTYRFDYFSRAFVRILAAEQTLDNTNWFQGTADAVRKNMIHLDLKGDEEILILSGDHLYNMDYREMVSFHRRHEADFTVSVIPIKVQEAAEFGVLRINESSRITGFKEKPATPSELKGFTISVDDLGVGRHLGKNCCLASMGVYLFNVKVLMKALEVTGDADFGKEVIPHSIKKFKGLGFLYHGYWRDVGTIRSYYDVSMDIAKHKPYLSFFHEGSVFTRPRFLPSPRIAKCRIEDSIIAEGSVIEDAYIKESIIGLRSIIGRRCTITRSVIMGADYYEDLVALKEDMRVGIGDDTIIERAIIDKNARIGRNVVIKNLKRLKNFDGTNYYIRDGIVIIPKNAGIKSGTRI